MRDINIRDEELVDACKDEDCEVLYLGPAPKAGRVVIANDEDGEPAFFWINQRASKRGRKPRPKLGPEIRAMIAAGLSMKEIIADSPVLLKRSK